MGELLINQKFNVHNKDNEMNIINPYRYAGLTPLQESIISYWNFDDNVNDQVGSNDGTATSVTYDTTYTPIVKGAFFNSAKVEISDDDSLSFGDSITDSAFSISFVLSLNSTNTQAFFCKRDTSTGDIEYQSFINGGDLYFACFDLTNANYIRQKVDWDYTGAPTAGYRVITYTYSGNGSTSGIKIYEDGVLQTMVASTGGTYTAMHNTGTPFFMGENSGGVSQLLGRIDEFYVFNKELDATEVTFVSDEWAAGRTLI